MPGESVIRHELARAMPSATSTSVMEFSSGAKEQMEASDGLGGSLLRFIAYLFCSAEEVAFILNGVIADQGIKTHGIENRVKTLDSIRRKRGEKDIASPLDELTDLVA